jgi:hypothetical protein
VPTDALPTLHNFVARPLCSYATSFFRALHSLD